MKNSPETRNLEAALEKHSGLMAEVESLRRLSVDSTANLQKLEAECDLGDAEALGEICSLQVLVALLPRRTAAKEQALTKTEAEVLQACHSFVGTTLSPKIRSLRQKMESKIKTELEPYFPNAETLNVAISSSALISGLDKLAHEASIVANPYDGVLNYARRTLETWKQAEIFAAKTA